MRFLGIDYGTKRVGISISDEEGRFAFPKAVFPNDNYLLRELKDLIKGHNIKTIVIGESKDYKMKDNPIMKNIKFFKDSLARETDVPIEFEPEFLSSHEAEYIQGKTDKLDASAAAIILQSHLDKLKS